MVQTFQTALSEEVLQVDDLQGWEHPTTHVLYDFDKFMAKAQEYSDKDPPDFIWFSYWAQKATAICVEEFFLISILIKSHAGSGAMFDVICAGFSGGEQGSYAGKVWDMTAKLHPNSHETIVMTKDDREVLLTSIKKMADIIKRANVAEVRANLNSAISYRIHPVQPDTFKIGNRLYTYTRVMH